MGDKNEVPYLSDNVFGFDRRKEAEPVLFTQVAIEDLQGGQSHIFRTASSDTEQVGWRKRLHG